MLRYVSNSLFRSVTQGARPAIANRQPHRRLEDLSYSKDFNDVKRKADEERIESRKYLDESTRRIRDATEGDFRNKGVTITTYSEFGFRLNGSYMSIGPIVLFPRSVFPWKIERLEDINEDSLCIFYLTEPKVDTLIIGTGDQPVTKEIAQTILEVTRKHRINIEILSTETACTTFNFLCNEGRMVGAALLPPRNVAVNDDDWIATQARTGKLFSMDNMTLDKI